ncbi:Stp1/IreP family PP2C-type Ser/Thr phosphatase [Edaphobacter sp.]|uniref:Stp1/IreP family PP2C-type Ser/Thr phosphatase n=1 Tax=Edaphobacter sp. TaxID=1934404 RepID=UPI002DBEC263|nr:Stp1/IreP family PP2C-type Ser/Thr phosphatase [Edaphobacter sp.]HEU5340116.1 Stp1/IreP family PP2C-type Ser/Thr phosphatase [Edaphobacter sp.]
MDAHKGLALEVAALSDVGCKRSNNEDSFGYDQASEIYVVCDGMGGASGGEIASAAAVAEVIRSFSESPGDGATAEERLYDAIVNANARVLELAQADARLQGMGTTLVTACFDARRIVIANVGDSRAYFLRHGACHQITFDHSFLAEQVRNGTMTEEAAKASPLQSLITRAVGTGESISPDLFDAELEPGDMVLLTTDGLTRYADAPEIAQVVGNAADLQEVCARLIDVAKQAGAVDNVTCLLLRAVEVAGNTAAA